MLHLLDLFLVNFSTRFPAKRLLLTLVFRIKMGLSSSVNLYIFGSKSVPKHSWQSQAHAQIQCLQSREPKRSDLLAHDLSFWAFSISCHVHRSLYTRELVKHDRIINYTTGQDVDTDFNVWIERFATAGHECKLRNENKALHDILCHLV